METRERVSKRAYYGGKGGEGTVRGEKSKENIRRRASRYRKQAESLNVGG